MYSVLAPSFVDQLSAATAIARAAELDAVAPFRPYWTTGLPADEFDRAEVLDAVAVDLSIADAQDEIEDAPCSCCGGRADVLPIVGCYLTVCRDCLRQMAESDAPAVERFLAEQDETPMVCPKCDHVGRRRDAGTLVDHLRCGHGLTDDHAVAVTVHAIEVRHLSAPVIAA